LPPTIFFPRSLEGNSAYPLIQLKFRVYSITERSKAIIKAFYKWK
jgi:hypothetical protein